MPDPQPANSPDEQTSLLSSSHHTNDPDPSTSGKSQSHSPTWSQMASFWTVGCIYGATSVAMGAFGAHGLKRRIADPNRIANWTTAAHYQMLHSGVLLLATSVAPKNKVAAGLFVAGMTMFSGSIYLLVLDPQRFKALGPVTPLGGLCLIAGWGALAFGSRGRLV